MGFFKVVNFEVLCRIVQALEEVHQVPQTDVHFHLVYALKNLCSFNFAINKERDLRAVEF